MRHSTFPPAVYGVDYNRGAEIRAATLAEYHQIIHAEPIGSAPLASDEWRRCVVNLYALEQTRRRILISEASPDDQMAQLGPTMRAIAGERQAIANFRITGRWA